MTKQNKIVTIAGVILVPLLMLMAFNALIIAPQFAEQGAEARGLSVMRITNPVQMMQSLSVAGPTAINGALTIGTYTQSGAVRFGQQANVISGTTIAHGFGTTPTMFIPRNYGIQATTFTQTLYAFGCDTVSCTVGVGQGSIVTFTVNWIAGK
jgi:hypothetical protein